MWGELNVLCPPEQVRCNGDVNQTRRRFVLPSQFQNRKEGLVEFHLRRCAWGFGKGPVRKIPSIMLYLFPLALIFFIIFSFYHNLIISEQSFLPLFSSVLWCCRLNITAILYFRHCISHHLHINPIMFRETQPPAGFTPPPSRLQRDLTISYHHHMGMHTYISLFGALLQILQKEKSKQRHHLPHSFTRSETTLNTEC